MPLIKESETDEYGKRIDKILRDLNKENEVRGSSPAWWRVRLIVSSLISFLEVWSFF